MSYNPNTPLVTTSFADWQINFKNNFTQLFNAFSINHKSLNSATNAGDHLQIELVQQDKSQQTNQGEISVYTKAVEGQKDQVFMRYQGNGTEFQYSTYQIYSILATTEQTFYFTFLPGNILAYFGQFNPTDTAKTLKLLPPVARNIISVNLTPIPGNVPANTPPAVSLVLNNNKTIVTGITLFTSGTTSEITSSSQFYIVLANI